MYQSVQWVSGLVTNEAISISWFCCPEADLAALQADNRRKQQIYDTQEFSPQDVQRINLERQELQRQIEATERDNGDIDRQVWDQEMVIGKAQEKVCVAGALIGGLG